MMQAAKTRMLTATRACAKSNLRGVSAKMLVPLYSARANNRLKKYQRATFSKDMEG